MEADNLHKSVLLRETVEMLAPEPGGIYMDCTLGLGGHAETLLETAENTRLIGIDQDREAIRLASQRLASFGDRVEIFHANFADVKAVLKKAGVQKVNGVLADLGVSSLQFDSAARGFSFRFDAPLDMRMDAESDDETAAELLERLSETEIADLIYRYGEERLSRRIARRIVWKREIGEPVRTTRELAETVEKAVGRKPKEKIHPATRTFQALRIVVNDELAAVEKTLPQAVASLKSGGRCAVISFHSLEDRIVKDYFREQSKELINPPYEKIYEQERKAVVKLINKKPITPTEEEMKENPRARSAKLRVVEKL